MSETDPYKVLQVDPEAERDVIEAAYRRLARKYHPDVSVEADSHEKMIAINRAWEQLRDPVKRAAADRARQRSNGTAAWVAASEAQARTAGTAGAPPRHGGNGGHGPIGRTYARPANTPSQPSGEPYRAGDPASWPLGMSDPELASAQSPTATRSWGAGRVPLGGASSGRAKGDGASGTPPGSPSGSVLNFGRFAGWSLGEIARTEIDYLEWLDRMPIGRTYQGEIDELLRAHGRRSSPSSATQGRGGPFRRR